MVRRGLVILAGFLFLVLPCYSAFAEIVVEPGSAAARIKLVFDDVTGMVKNEKNKLSDSELDHKLREIIVPAFNFEEMSRRSLGQEWNKVTSAQQQEFVSLFSDLLARTYLKRIKRNAEAATVLRIKQTVNDGKATVRTVVNSEGQEVQIDYRMAQFLGDWRIYDVVIENVGLVSNYRNEFPGIIQKEGFNGLLARLKEKQIGHPEQHEK